MCKKNDSSEEGYHQMLVTPHERFEFAQWSHDIISALEKRNLKLTDVVLWFLWAATLWPLFCDNQTVDHTCDILIKRHDDETAEEAAEYATSDAAKEAAAIATVDNPPTTRAGGRTYVNIENRKPEHLSILTVAQVRAQLEVFEEDTLVFLDTDLPAHEEIREMNGAWLGVTQVFLVYTHETGGTPDPNDPDELGEAALITSVGAENVLEWDDH